MSKEQDKNVVERPFAFALTRAELDAAVADQQAKIARLYDRQTEKKTVTATLGAEIKTLEAEVSELHRTIRTRTKWKTRKVREKKDLVLGILEWVDVETGVVLDERTLDIDERQVTLPFPIRSDPPANDSAPMPLTAVPAAEPLPTEWVSLRIPRLAYDSRSKAVRDRLDAHLADVCAESGVPVATWNPKDDFVETPAVRRGPSLAELDSLCRRLGLVFEEFPARPREPEKDSVPTETSPEPSTTPASTAEAIAPTPEVPPTVEPEPPTPPAPPSKPKKNGKGKGRDSG